MDSGIWPAVLAHSQDQGLSFQAAIQLRMSVLSTGRCGVCDDDHRPHLRPQPSHTWSSRGAMLAPGA